jgi:hypothetical protein
LHTDETTQKARNIQSGDGTEWKVNDQDYVLSILSQWQTKPLRDGRRADLQPVPPWEWRTIKQFGVNRYDPRSPVPPEQE